MAFLGTLASTVHAEEIWLSGLDPIARKAVEPGVPSDYMDLFQTDAPWSGAAGHVQVFKTSTQFLARASDEQLRRMFTDLKRRRIVLAFEALMMTGRNGCGEGVEGYSALDAIQSVTLRIKRLGGELGYVAMDEPLWFGHHYAGADACHSSVAEIARDVAGKVAVIRRSFPNVQIGDIEPLPFKDQPADWPDEIAQWVEAYRAATGENLAFFDADVDWHQNWHPRLVALAAVLKRAGIKFGVIYNGDPADPNGVAWVRHAEERFVAVQADPALEPDRAILQTWMSYPSHMLPESQPGTMTWLVNRYAAAKTQLTMQRVGGRLDGQLTGPGGKPLPGQRLKVEAIDIQNGGPPIDRVLSGTVPAGVESALFILRINMECSCSGPVNVTLGPASYRDDHSGQMVMRMFAVRGGAKGLGGTHIVAPSGRRFAVNTAPWPVTPGDKWTIHVMMGAAAASIDSGYTALVFRRKDGREISRMSLWFGPTARPLGEVVTDLRGRFTFVPNASVLGQNPGFRVEFSGNPALRLSRSATQ